jgi:hypothetical protein
MLQTSTRCPGHGVAGAREPQSRTYVCADAVLMPLEACRARARFYWIAGRIPISKSSQSAPSTASRIHNA